MSVCGVRLSLAGGGGFAVVVAVLLFSFPEERWESLKISGAVHSANL